MIPSPTVIDTNVFVAAAFKPRSDSARLLAAVRDGQVRLIWNEATRRETEAVCRRIPPVSWGHFADLFREENRDTSEVDASSFSSVPDPDDRKFAALAAATEAVLVSLDEHLLGAKLESQPIVCTPSRFLAGS